MELIPKWTARTRDQLLDYSIAIAWKLAQFLIIFITSLSISCLIYFILYWTLIPQVAHEESLRLIYPFLSKMSASSKSSSIIEELNADGMISGWADFSRDTFQQVLSNSQTYDVNVELLLPNNHVNTQSGNFMISVHLLNVPLPMPGSRIKNIEEEYLKYMLRNSTVLYSASKPAILFYKSRLVQTVEILMQLPMMLAGFNYAESQLVKTQILTNIKDDYDLPITHAFVKISPFIHMQGSSAGGEHGSPGAKYPQIYDAIVRLDAHFEGIRYLMYYMALPTGLVCIGVLTLILMFTVSFSLFIVKSMLSVPASSSTDSLTPLGSPQKVKQSDNITKSTKKQDETTSSELPTPPSSPFSPSEDDEELDKFLLEQEQINDDEYLETESDPLLAGFESSAETESEFAAIAVESVAQFESPLKESQQMDSDVEKANLPIFTAQELRQLQQEKRMEGTSESEGSLSNESLGNSTSSSNGESGNEKNSDDDEETVGNSEKESIEKSAMESANTTTSLRHRSNTVQPNTNPIVTSLPTRYSPKSARDGETDYSKP